MPKLTLANLTSAFLSVTRMNANFQAIRDAFDNTLSRDGSTPNQMQAVLDMNSNRVINIGAPVNPNDAVRLSDLEEVSSGGGLSVEEIQDLIASTLVAGPNVTLAYDDVAGTITVSSTAAGGGFTEEQVQDIIGAMVVAGANVTVTYNDVAGTLTIASSGGAGATNLSLANRGTNTLDILSDTGTDVTLPAATTSLTGLLTAADKTKLDGLSATLADGSVTNAKLANAAANTLKANPTGSSGVPSDLAIAASRIVGRGPTGNLVGLTAGSGITITDTQISASGGGDGTRTLRVPVTEPLLNELPNAAGKANRSPYFDAAGTQVRFPTWRGVDATYVDWFKTGSLTDDQAMQAAISTLDEGEVINLLNRQYDISTTIQLKSGQTLRGKALKRSTVFGYDPSPNSTNLRWIGTSGATMINLGAPNDGATLDHLGGGLEHMWVDANYSALYAVRAAGWHNGTVRGVVIAKPQITSAGRAFLATGQTSFSGFDNTLRNCRFEDVYLKAYGSAWAGEVKSNGSEGGITGCTFDTLNVDHGYGAGAGHGLVISSMDSCDFYKPGFNRSPDGTGRALWLDGNAGTGKQTLGNNFHSIRCGPGAEVWVDGTYAHQVYFRTHEVDYPVVINVINGGNAFIDRPGFGYDMVASRALAISNVPTLISSGPISDKDGNVRGAGPLEFVTSPATVTASQFGKTLECQATATLTIPTGLPANMSFRVFNRKGTTLSLIQGSGVTLLGMGVAGTRDLANNTMYYIERRGTTEEYYVQ